MKVNSFFKNFKKPPELPDLSNLSFQNIIDLPDKVYVHDFSIPNVSNKSHTYSIGKYNEKRPNMYKGNLFEKWQRYIHMGIDIGAPIGTPVKSFFEGEIFSFKYNDLEFDYGYTIITRHRIKNQNIYALYGHLSKDSILDKKIGLKLQTGETIGYLGSEKENGGWPPHVHFQLSLVEPKNCDLPGVVSEIDHEIALMVFPDPRLVLGRLY